VLERMKRILVACGTAMATSTVVARKIGVELARRGIEVEISQCSTSEVASQIEGYDLVVTTRQISETHGIPVLCTVSFLTGIQMEADIERIIEFLKINEDSRRRGDR